MGILKSPFERAEELKTTRGQWVVASLDTHMSWPRRPQALEYGAREFLILPAERPDPSDKSNPLQVDKAPAICLRADAYGITPEQARSEIMRFASALVWRTPAKLEIVSWTGGQIPRQMGFARHRAIQDHLESELLPEPTDPASRKALALYREGVSLDNPFYAFLSLYKAFSVAVPAKERGDFIKGHRAQLRDRAKTRMEAVESAGDTLERYLYDQGRHAIAHAERDPSVDPDSTDDHFRIQQDIPLMAAFAEIAIEEKLRVKRGLTLYKEHLYELEGFRELLSSGALQIMRQGDGIPLGENISWPENWVILAACGVAQYPLPEMKLLTAVWVAGVLILRYGSGFGSIQVRLCLDFQSERLLFNPLHDFFFNTTRVNRTLIEQELASMKFQLGILGNGHIEIWDADRERRMGRSETCIPVNCFVNDKYFKEEFEQLEALLHQPDLNGPPGSGEV